ncbi:hypothetical protein HK096_002971 [Nowakowskiella sp. JEL0078]|nr:hypothetical protein HK096_002971 [Nowakowskiella sp. JEL0078]
MAIWSKNATMNLEEQLLQYSRTPLITKEKIRELAARVDPAERLDPEAEEVDLTEEFVKELVELSCKLSNHRNGNSLEIRDMLIPLEKNFNIKIPGFKDPEEEEVVVRKGRRQETAPGFDETKMERYQTRLERKRAAQKSGAGTYSNIRPGRGRGKRDF